MQARRTGFMSFALALAVHLGAQGAALADDALLSARPKQDGASTAQRRGLLGAESLPFGAAYLPTLVAADASERGSGQRGFTPGPRLDLGERGRCTGCKGAAGQRTLRVADAIFQGSGALELLGAFVLPGRRGVTVATSDGVPTLSLAMMRTDITRGSGLCAMGKF